MKVNGGLYSGTYGRKIVFAGDSIFNCTGVTPIVLGGQYIPTTCYNSLISGRVLMITSFASTGNTLSAIDTNFASKEGVTLRYSDIYVIQAVTNDLGTDLKTAAQAYASLTSICAKARVLGAKIIVCTMPARDKAGDPADIETQRTDYNNLVIANSPNICDYVCGFGADPVFDTQADCANATYYATDLLHLAIGGSNVEATLLTTTLTTALS